MSMNNPAGSPVARRRHPSCRRAEPAGRNRSEIVREALRRHLAIQTFEALRQRAAPFAEAAGYLTDEDVFRDVS